MDNINKIPQNANLWFIYLLSYINENILLEDISKITYCIDFLYSKIELKPNETCQLVNKVKWLLEKIKEFYKEDGSYRSSLKVSPLEETRFALFSINLLEDLTQDLIYTQTNQVSKNLRLKRFKSVRKGIRRYRGYGDYSLQIYQKQIVNFKFEMINAKFAICNEFIPLSP